jgi:gamma-glutamylcyclotransferase (GGCT)/AIG2-like uncharacterized protein YtfP
MVKRKRLYIAYGSNMNLEQMAFRCPTAKMVGTTFLRNWQLIFCGVASVERFHGGKVPVVVWELQPEDECALDIYEGWPRMYRKETVRVALNGKLVRAMIYIMNSSRQNPPGTGYYNTIRDGYKSAGFDVNILREAAERSRKKERNPMNPTVREQILAVRATGKTNMLDINGVQRVAYDMEFYERVNFIEDDRKAYVNFIFTGKTGKEEETQ